MKTKPSI